MLTGLEIEKLLKQSGVPDDVFQVALGAKGTGELLLELPFDGYFFTGSYKTGKYIYEKCRIQNGSLPAGNGRKGSFVCSQMILRI